MQNLAMKKLNSIFDQVFDLNLLIYKTIIRTSQCTQTWIFFKINLLELLTTLFCSFQDHALFCLSATLCFFWLPNLNYTLLFICWNVWWFNVSLWLCCYDRAILITGYLEKLPKNLLLVMRKAVTQCSQECYKF